jgi:hypothetical protein
MSARIVGTTNSKALGTAMMVANGLIRFVLFATIATNDPNFKGSMCGGSVGGKWRIFKFSESEPRRAFASS